MRALRVNQMLSDNFDTYFYLIEKWEADSFEIISYFSKHEKSKWQLRST